MRKINNIPYITFIYVFLIVLSFLVLYPLLASFFSSFKTNSEILTSGARLLPESFSLDNYVEAWTLGNFAQYTFNSLYTTFFIVVGVLINCTIGGYVFSRGHFIGKKFLYSIFTANMLFSLGSMVLLPQYMIAQSLSLTDNLSGVIIIRVFSINVANLLIMKGFVDSLPKELDEAAKIDGCSFFGIYWRIILPLLKPIIATVGLIAFKQAWNDYLLPMVFTLSNRDNTTLVVGIVALQSSGETVGAWNLMLAGTMISVIPMILVYLILKRYFISGITEGAVKG